MTITGGVFLLRLSYRPLDQALIRIVAASRTLSSDARFDRIDVQLTRQEDACVRATAEQTTMDDVLAARLSVDLSQCGDLGSVAPFAGSEPGAGADTGLLALWISFGVLLLCAILLIIAAWYSRRRKRNDRPNSSAIMSTRELSDCTTTGYVSSLPSVGEAYQVKRQASGFLV